jgi:thiamine biosynthesis lipoprotein
MKKKIFFSFFLCFIIILILFINLNKKNSYYKIYSYFDTDIIITLYDTNKTKSNNIFNKIEDIYSLYDKLLDKQNKYDNLENLYTINHNFLKDDSIKISSELADLIKYGLDIYEKSDNYIDISKGNIWDLWDAYLTTKINKPSNLELTLANNQNIEDIVLNDENELENNHVNLNFNLIIKGYVLDIICDLLKENNIDYYTINDGENIIVGKSLNDNYKIGIEDPDNENNVLTILSASEEAISITDYSNNYYVEDNTRYHSYISSKTLYPANNFKSVIVISDDIKNSEYLSKTLFFMSLEEGKEFIKDKNYKKIYWYTLDDEMIEM